MANVNAPFGFADSHRLGAAVNYQMARRWILATNPTPIYTGDPILMSAGYIQQAPGSTGTQVVAGIFCGCEYMSISQKKWIANAWWPGNDAVQGGQGFDVYAKIIDDPLTVFRVMTGTTGPCTEAMVGKNANFIIGTGNQVTGKSGSYLDVTTTAPASTATMPFRIVDLVRDPPGSNGADPTTAFNWAYVTFNNQDFRTLTPN